MAGVDGGERAKTEAVDMCNAVAASVHKVHDGELSRMRALDRPSLPRAADQRRVGHAERHEGRGPIMH